MDVNTIINYDKPRGYNLIFIPTEKYNALEDIDKEELMKGDPYERRLYHSGMGHVRAFWIHPLVAERMIDKYRLLHFDKKQ